MNTEAERRQEIEVIYLGQRESEKGKLACAFVPAALVSGETDQEQLRKAWSLFFFKEREVPRLVGGIYKLGCVLGADGRIEKVYGTAKPTSERWNNTQATAMCEAHDKAARVAKRARAEQERLRKDGTLARLLTPLRARYDATDFLGRVAIECVILAELRRGM